MFVRARNLLFRAPFIGSSCFRSHNKKGDEEESQELLEKRTVEQRARRVKSREVAKEEITFECLPRACGGHEFDHYIRTNQLTIPNYGDRYRNEEAITSAIAESSVNQIVSRRFVKKQQIAGLGAVLICCSRSERGCSMTPYQLPFNAGTLAWEQHILPLKSIWPLNLASVLEWFPISYSSFLFLLCSPLDCSNLGKPADN